MLVMCGAIFSHIEGWTFLESVYFVVVTISTVGFGDFCAGKPDDVFFYVNQVYFAFCVLRYFRPGPMTAGIIYLPRILNYYYY